MSPYRCSQCGTVYDSDEYHDLGRVLVNEDNPKQGYERVCGCGARFHSDKWRLVEEIEVDGDTFHVSTVALNLAHGLEHNQWFETLISGPMGDGPMERYETQEEAEAGHEDFCKRLRAGDYHFVPTGKRLVMGDA